MQPKSTLLLKTRAVHALTKTFHLPFFLTWIYLCRPDNVTDQYLSGFSSHLWKTSPSRMFQFLWTKFSIRFRDDQRGWNLTTCRPRRRPRKIHPEMMIWCLRHFQDTNMSEPHIDDYLRGLSRTDILGVWNLAPTILELNYCEVKPKFGIKTHRFLYIWGHETSFFGILASKSPWSPCLGQAPFRETSATHCDWLVEGCHQSRQCSYHTLWYTYIIHIYIIHIYIQYTQT